MNETRWSASGGGVARSIGAAGRHSERSRQAAVARRALPVLCGLLASVSASILMSAPVAGAAPALGWSAPAPADPAGQPTSVSCPLLSLCVAVDGSGNVLSTTDPTAAAPTWAVASIDAGRKLSAVSCVSATLCVAVDDRGDALAGTDPTGGAGAWSPPLAIDGGRELTGVSCPASTLCVAVDAAGNALVGTDPAKGTWQAAASIDGSTALTGVSCASASLCVATAGDGAVLATGQPTGAASAWRRRQVGAVGGSPAVSCGSGGVCLVVDPAGNAAASGDPTGATPTWSSTEIDPGRSLTAASCAPLGQCVAVDDSGRALASEAPTLVPPAWAAANPDATGLVAVSCAAASFCLALDQAGRSLSAALPPPPSPVAPPPTPRPSILGTPALGSLLSCQPGLAAAVPGAQLSYAWLRESEPIGGAIAPTYTVARGDEGRHLQCRVTATDAAGTASGTSAFVTVPFQGLPVASGETVVGRARGDGGRLLVPVACSGRAPHGCTLLLRLLTTGPGRRATLGGRRVRVRRGARATVAVGLSAAGRRLLARQRRVAALLLVSGTVIGSIEAALSEQRLALSEARGRVGMRVLSDLKCVECAGKGGVFGSLFGASGASWRSPARDGSWATVVAARGALAGTPLAATPYMGWDSYLAFGPRYSESTVLEQASDLLTLGLARRGYRFVWLDVGWWQGQREADGQIAVDRAQWPHGLAWLAATLHHAGLRLGIYTDAGADGCGGVGQGSFGDYRQDADTFAAWGVDAVKVDFCGGARLGLEPGPAYSAFRAALDASGRPMLLSICDFLQPGERGEGDPPSARSAFTSYLFGPQFGNSWRTDGDIGVPGHVPFGNVLRNLDADAAHPEAAGPGHWNDPDYLGPDQGMSSQQFRTQVSMWAMLAAPLMVSGDLGRLSRASLAALGDREAIAVDQDPLGAQATLLASEGAGQVWVKPLADGSRAVALLNRGPTGLRIATDAAAIGLSPGRRYAVRDLWRRTESSTAGAIAEVLGGYSTALLRVAPR